MGKSHSPENKGEALELYLRSVQPTQWEQRRLAAAYLLKVPLNDRFHWDLLASGLEVASPPPSAWEYWQRYATVPRAHGLFGPYQNRLSGLRQAQLQSSADRLRPILEKDDYAAYLAALPRLGDSSGPLRLAWTLQPHSRIGRDDLMPQEWWWPILMNQSQHQALRAGIRLARGQTPEMAHRWEGQTCVCWSPGIDGSDEGGKIEADPQALESVGDWVYRFR